MKQTINTYKLSELIGKRMLINQNSGRYGSAILPQEVKFIEHSHSGEYVKLMNDNGRKYWINFKSFDLVEVLNVIINDIPKDND